MAERASLPKFQFMDEVRALSVTGAETDNAAWPVDAASLNGQTVGLKKA